MVTSYNPRTPQLNGELQAATCSTEASKAPQVAGHATHTAKLSLDDQLLELNEFRPSTLFSYGTRLFPSGDAQ